MTPPIAAPAARPPSYRCATWIFLRGLGAIYFIAFLSFGIQANGLIGSRGILPMANFLALVKQGYGASAWRLLPTLFWLNSSDAMLRAVWISGLILAAAVMLGQAWRLSLVLLYVLYLSIVSGGQTFMAYQWDLLLLEAGFLAIFLDGTAPRAWLAWWLVFRLMFLSGCVKLMSGDPTWRHLTALRYHYETQPLPTPIAWYMFQLPGWFQSISTAIVFVAELGFPLLILCGRRLRPWAALGIVAFQSLIALTGNYTFFNLLTILLCAMLFDDEAWRNQWLTRYRPVKRAMEWIEEAAARAFRPARWPRLRLAATVALYATLGTLTLLVTVETLGLALPSAASTVVDAVAPFGIANSYGLFASMTTTRPEIVVQGSRDGTNWVDYEFRFKAGNIYEAPHWVAPYQPRLDWQMWFAALGTYRSSPFFLRFMERLLKGDPTVLALLRGDPFHGTPPRYIRAQLYEYHFTDIGTRWRTGAWWRRELIGEYFPAVSLK
jgi:Lipase maturation factor